MSQAQVIGPDDLHKIEDVLNGRTSLHAAAVEFTPWLSGLLGVTILRLAGWTQATKKGEYSRLLDALCQEPGAPDGGWPAKAPIPEWYLKKSSHYLMAYSRTNGWHKSPGGAHGPQILNAPPEIAPFERNPDYRDRASEFVERVYRGLRAEPAPEVTLDLDASADFKVFKDALLKYPEIGGLPAVLIKNCSSAGQFAAAVTALGLTVRQHLPERPTS